MWQRTPGSNPRVESEIHKNNTVMSIKRTELTATTSFLNNCSSLGNMRTPGPASGWH